MSEIVNLYLKQIKKKLQVENLPKKFIEEIIENIEDQIDSQLDERDITNEEEIKEFLIQNYEPVDVLIARIVKEHYADLELEEGRTEKQPNFQISIGLLKETLIDPVRDTITVTKYNLGLIRDWYNRNNNPLLTVFAYLLALLSLLTIGFFVENIFPVYLVETSPGNKMYFFLNDVPSWIYNNDGINTISVTFITSPIVFSLLGIGSLILFIRLGYTKPLKHALITLGYLQLIGIIPQLFNKEFRYNLINFYSIPKYSNSLSFSIDWYSAAPP